MSPPKRRRLYTGKRYMGRKITACGFFVPDPWATRNAARVTCKRCGKIVQREEEEDDHVDD